MNTPPDETLPPEQKRLTREAREAYWSSYQPRLVKAVDMEHIEDWRSVDLDSLSPNNRRLIMKFRDRARELGLELADAPEFATEMYKPPYSTKDDASKQRPD